MRTLFLLLLLLFALRSSAQMQQPLRPVAPENVLSKNAYLSFMLSRNVGMRQMLTADKTLGQLGLSQYKALSEASNSLEGVKAMKVPSNHAKQIALRLASLYDNNSSFRSFVDDSVMTTGCYDMVGGTGRERLMKAWYHDVKALNHVVDVYGGGCKPNYPLIDSISFDVRSHRFNQEIFPLVKGNILFATDGDAFFAAIPLQSAQCLLMANDRLQASDEEPLANGLNKVAYAAVARTAWRQYPYSAVVVLGVGPETLKERVTAESLLRANYAAQCWQRKLVPFIIVSGGKVHPYHTPYCEAVEMRNYLRLVCHVPDSVIIVEPHARHTTTNLRNAGRIMIRQGFPMDKPALVTGSKSHMDYVCSDTFQQRFLKELGYLPVSLLKRKDNRLSSFFVNHSCLQIDDDEPMDP